MVVSVPRRVLFGFAPREEEVVGGEFGSLAATWHSLFSLAREGAFSQVQVELFAFASDRRRVERVRAILEGELARVFERGEVRVHELRVDDPGDMAQVFGSLCKFCDRYDFGPVGGDDALFFAASGVLVEQLSTYMVVSNRYFPGKLVCSAVVGDLGGRGTTGPLRTKTSTLVKKGRDVASLPYEVGAGLRVVDLDEVRRAALDTLVPSEQVEGEYLLPSGLAVRSSRLRHLLRDVEGIVEGAPSSILLRGSSAAGRSEIARKIFEVKRSKKRCADRFVEVNCSALPRECSSVMLFGDGSGAVRRDKGLISSGRSSLESGAFQRAEGGVLFLDEIDSLGLDDQTVLVQAINSRGYLSSGQRGRRESSFQLIAGTDAELELLVQQGRFRKDLFSLIQTWSFAIPAITQRRDDIEPFVEFELQQIAVSVQRRVRFSAEARARYLEFAVGDSAQWPGDFHDVRASVVRLAASAEAGVIGIAAVEREIKLLMRQWKRQQEVEGDSVRRDGSGEVLSGAARVLREVGVSPSEVDLFDQAQLAAVVGVVKSCTTIAEAGRRLFAVSRKDKGSLNDTDRLRKYLAKFGIDSRKLVGTEEQSEEVE